MQVVKIKSTAQSSSLTQIDDNLDNELDDFIDPISGVKVCRRLISILELERKMHYFKVLPISKFSSYKNENSAEETALAIHGVVSSRSPIRKTNNGNGAPYIVIKIADLHQNELSLFLFNAAFHKYKNIDLFTFVYVLEPKINSNSGGVAVSLYKVNQLLVVGTAMSYSYCLGTKKSGSGKCKVVIDKLQGNYCKFHLKEAQKQLQQERQALQHGGKFGQKNNSRKGMKNISTGLFQFNNQRIPADTQSAAAHIRKSPSHALARTVSGKSFHTSSIGARNIAVAHVNSKSIAGTTRESLMKVSSAVSVGSSNRTLIDWSTGAPSMKSSKNQEERVKDKARVLLKQGAFDNDPNGRERPTFSKPSSKAIFNSRPTSFHPRPLIITKDKPSEKENSDVHFSEEKYLQLVNAKSKNHQMAEDSFKEDENAFFEDLRKRDLLEQRMDSVKEIEITSFFCRDCDTIRERPCQKQDHVVIKKKVTKRFFTCTKCGLRAESINSHNMLKNCVKCGSSEFQSSSMYRKRKNYFDYTPEASKLRLTEAGARMPKAGPSAEW